ncbi:MAG: hypothetical protein ACYC7E_05380 [Armatimonadota bacterium]
MYQEVLKFITENHLPGLLWTTVGWTIFGSIAGLLLGLLVFFGIRRLGGYRLELPAAVWLRALVGVLTVIIALVCGGIFGFNEGVLRGVRRVVQEGAITERFVPQVGHSGALLLAGLYNIDILVNANNKQEAQQQLEAKFKSFAAGDWELDVHELQRRVDNVPVTAANVALGAILENPSIRIPEIRNTPLGKVQRWLLVALEQGLIPDQAEGFAEEWGAKEIRKFCANIYRGLPAEAAKSGNPNTIACTELSVYLGRQSLSGLVLPLTKAFVRGHQFSVLLFFLIILAVPVVGFQLGEFIRRKKCATAETQNPDSTIEA